MIFFPLVQFFFPISPYFSTFFSPYISVLVIIYHHPPPPKKNNNSFTFVLWVDMDLKQKYTDKYDMRDRLRILLNLKKINLKSAVYTIKLNFLNFFTKPFSPKSMCDFFLITFLKSNILSLACLIYAIYAIR